MRVSKGYVGMYEYMLIESFKATQYAAGIARYFEVSYRSNWLQSVGVGLYYVAKGSNALKR